MNAEATFWEIASEELESRKRYKYSTFSEAQYWEVTRVLDHSLWEELSDSMWADGLAAIASRVIATEGGEYWCNVDEDTFWKIVFEELG